MRSARPSPLHFLAAIMLMAGIALTGDGPLAKVAVTLVIFATVPVLTLMGGALAGGLLAALWLCGIMFEPMFRGLLGEPPSDAWLGPWRNLGGPVLAFGLGLVARVVRTFTHHLTKARADANHANTELLSLREALDASLDGIVVLDAEYRAQYANKAFRNLFHIPAKMADRKPTFGEIVDHGCRLRLYAVDEQHLESFAETRKAFVRFGTPVPVMLRMAGPKIIRFKCSHLPAGGRLLNYTDVTDLVADAERLEELANIDGMTGLLNRRQFFELGEQEWNRAERYNRPVSALMLDIDHFKSVNDRFGHDIGDQAICHIASICKDSKRSSDIAGRLGGEEFAMLLPETTLEGALVVAERIRTRVEANPLVIQGHLLELTVSIGVCQHSIGGEGLHGLLKQADLLLYAAKNAGRNRIEHMAPGQDEKNVAAA